MKTPSRKGLALWFPVAGLIAIGGCNAVRPMAHRGHDLLDNPGRSALVRGPAGIGAIVGYTFAAPVGLLLAPTYPFRSLFVRDAYNYHVPPPVEEAGRAEEEGHGDIYIPLALAPFDYGSGIGSALFGGPIERISRLFGSPPEPPPGTVHEVPEEPPGTEDPSMSFAIRPPATKG